MEMDVEMEVNASEGRWDGGVHSNTMKRVGRVSKKEETGEKVRKREREE